MFRRLYSLTPLLAFAIALTALLGSLYAQHIGIEPCVLCWWQRIFMYPLVIIIPLSMWRTERELSTFVLPFGILGGLTALYHTLLYYGKVSEAFAPCNINVPCTQILPSFLGLNLITASLGSFIAIIVLMIIHRRFNHEII